jgi:hypothetical protein
LTASASLPSPPAPSPAAPITSGPPPVALPVVGVNVFEFTGGVLTPFWKFSEADVRSVMNPSRIHASTSSVRGPSTNFWVGSSNWYGA